MEPKERVARRVALEFKNGDYINLGIGIPSLAANYVPEGVNIFLHAENGFLGMGPAPGPGREDADLVNAGGRHSSILPGGATFDVATSFGIMRGGHLNACVLGALEVDEEGSLASWMIPGQKIAGMGGAMDLVVGARRVIVAMEHTAKGRPKLLRRCRLPLTAASEADLLVTEMGVFDWQDGLRLAEIAPGLTVEDVRAATEAEFKADGVKSMKM